MKDLTLADLDRFQRCRALYASGIEVAPDPFHQAIKQAFYNSIFYALTHKQESSRAHLRAFWDKHWLVVCDKQTISEQEKLDLAVKGWLKLDELHTRLLDWAPVGADFVFPWTLNRVVFRVHFDALFDTGKGLAFLTFEDLPTGFLRYSALTTRLEIAALSDFANRLPVQKLSVNLGKQGVEPFVSSLTISPDYVKDSNRLLNGLTYDILHSIIYPSPGKQCAECPVLKAGKTECCWNLGGTK